MDRRYRRFTATWRCDDGCDPAWATAAGAVREGFHAHRLPAPLPDWALWDVVGTVLVALLTARATGWPWPVCLIGWFAAGQALHVWACVPTAGRATLGL